MAEEGSLQDARYAPPAAVVDDVAPASGAPVLAGRGARLLAAIIDVIVAIASVWITSVVTPWDPWSAEAMDAGWWQVQLDAVLIGFVLFVVVHGYLLATRGQTLGKLALGIRIARPDGSAASLARVLGLRYGVGYLTGIVLAVGQLFAFVDALLIFRSSRRCLHDTIADTIVVKA